MIAGIIEVRLCKPGFNRDNPPFPFPAYDHHVRVKTFPDILLTLWFATDRPWKEIMSDRSACRGQLVNEAIVQIIHDEATTGVIKGSSQFAEVLWICGYCGGAHYLGDTCGCTYASRRNHNCFTHFVDMALPPKIVAHAENCGLTFRIRPELAQRAEQRWWKSYLRKGYSVDLYRPYRWPN